MAPIFETQKMGFRVGSENGILANRQAAIEKKVIVVVPEISRHFEEIFGISIEKCKAEMTLKISR